MMCDRPTLVLTGAASGIGRDTALVLAKAGWRLVLLDRDAQGLERLAQELGPDHQAIAIDLCDAAQISALTAKVTGRVHAIINNAGMSDTSGIPLAERSFSTLDPVIALNMLAPLRLIDALAGKLMVRARIINIASGAGLKPIPMRGAYSPSKSGLIGMGASLQRAMPDHDIITLCPGFIRTALVDSLIASGRLDPIQSVAKIPLSRMARPAEVAGFLRFLLSPDAAGLAGQTISFDGGSSIYGGSKAYLPMDYALSDIDEPVNPSFDLPFDTAVQGYPAYISDLRGVSPQDMLAELHRLAMGFHAAQAGPASLMLWLPDAAPELPIDAAFLAAAEMLVKTLACELGPYGKRINGLRGPAPISAIRTLAGPAAQYLTGQILSFRAEA